VKRRGKFVTSTEHVQRWTFFLKAALADTHTNCSSLGSPKLWFQRTWYRFQHRRSQGEPKGPCPPHFQHI